MTAEGEFENSLIVYTTGKSDSAQSKIEKSFIADSTNGINKDTITVTEYEDYVRISISDSAENTTGKGGKFQFELSSQFNNSLLPILFSGSDDKISLTVSANGTYNSYSYNDSGEVSGVTTSTSSTEIIKDMAGNSPTAISGTSNKYLNYYILKGADPSYDASKKLTKDISKFTLTLTISNFKANAQITLFKPLKIEGENEVLDLCTDKSNKDKTSVKAKVNSLAKTTINGQEVTLFDYSYQIDEEDIIENPLEAESFFKSNHIYNKYVIAQLDTGTTVDKKDKLNIRVAKQSLQSYSRSK